MANTQNYKKPITRKNTKAQTPVVTARIDRMIDDDSKLKAFASVNVAGAVAIHGIHVMDSRKGLFVSMPSRSYTDASGQQKFAEVAHAVTKEAHDTISEKVLEAYQQKLEESQSDGYDENENEDEDLNEDEDESEGFTPSM